MFIRMVAMPSAEGTKGESCSGMAVARTTAHMQVDTMSIQSFLRSTSMAGVADAWHGEPGISKLTLKLGICHPAN